MGKLKEATIQDRAIEYLKNHYAKHSNAIYSKREVRTTKGKRADGLLCFIKDGKPYTVSLEAKSHKTLGALLSSNNDEKFLLQSMLVSSIITFLIVLGLNYSTLIAWYYISLIALAAFIIVVFLTAVVFDFLDLNNHRIINVINQLKQYPANEQWIAYSKHTYNLLLNSSFERNRNNVEVLRELCIKDGFGLLLVTRNGCTEELYPKAKKGVFLQHYCQERGILKIINRRESALEIN